MVEDELFKATLIFSLFHFILDLLSLENEVFKRFFR